MSIRKAMAFAAICVAAALPTWADTFTWTGGGANKNWSTAANWSPAGTMTASDTANFKTGTLSSDTIIYDSGAFSGITVQSGAWTANVASASFTGKPITISSGATFALKGAGSVTNPFSTTKNANAISGLLDLGGASQTIADDMGGNNAGFFRNGGEIRNGTLTVSGSPTAGLKNTTFTIGPGANLTGAVRYYLSDGANLIVDGGSIRSTTTGSNHPIGSNTSQSHLTVRNGGLFAVSKDVWIAHKGTGYMIGDGGTYDLGSSTLFVAINTDTTAILALTNSTLTCGSFRFGYNNSLPKRQTAVIKDSVAIMSKFVGTKLATNASFLLDGAVLVPKAAATDFFPNSAAIPTPTLDAGGLIVSNSYDVTIAKGLAGAGKLVKEGSATLTLTGAHTFTGGIDLRKGTLALDPNVSLANSTLTMSGGATLKLKFTPGVGFVTSNLAAALDVNSSGNVTIEIDSSDGLPEEDRPYTLFASGLDAASLSHISIVPNSVYALAVADGGAVTITLQRVPVTHTWTGGGADAKWTTSGNWDTAANFGAFDSVVFGGTGSYSIYDCGEVLITNVTIQSGAHTANVAAVGFSGFPVTVASGAEFKLDGANGVTNPFSTEMNANAISGVLDLGGASQTITTVLNGTGALRDGGEIRNGTVTLNSDNWGIFLDNSFFTAGVSSHFTCNRRFYFQSGANFKIDGGSFINTDTSGNHVVGAGTSGSFSTFEVSNGGRVVTQYLSPNGDWFIGHTASGALVGDGAILDFSTARVFLSNNAGVTSTLALTNSVLSCGNIQFSYGTANNISTQTLVLKNTLVNLSSFVFRRKADDSSILFDGATLVPTGAAADFLPSGLPTPQLGAGGLVISNAFDVTVAAGMTGAGGLVKKGEGVLTLSGANTFTGGIDVREGSLSLGVASSFADSTLAMASGTTLKLKFSPDGGFVTSNLVLSLDANAEGKVALEIDTSAGIPEVNNPYTLFASGLDAESLGRIMIDPAYSLAITSGGLVTLTLSPTTHTWTGGGADAKWTTTANWNTDDAFKTFDHVVFNSAAGYSIYDCADGLHLGSITAASGVHTANVETACFDNVPITVASGATFALENADGVTNAFSTVANTNAIAGVLDLGGSTQTFYGPSASCNGGEICNGTLKMTGGDHVMNNTTFTFGKNADMSGSMRFYLQNGAHFILDGAAYTNGNSNSHVIGGAANGAQAILEVSNGGRLTTQRDWFIGHNGSGALVGDGGVIDFGSSTIIFSNTDAAPGVIALTNSVLTCGNLNFGYNSSRGAAQTLVLKDTTVNLSTIVFNHKTADSSILFDGATLVPRAAAATLLPSGLPTPQLGAGGLVISNAFDAGVAVGMAGAGGLVKMGDGALTVSANQSFTGDVVVSGGTFTSSSTFAGGLRVASGVTLDVASATFGGNIAIDGPVETAATNGVNWAEVKAVPVAKTTAGVVAFPGGYDAEGRHFFVRRSEGKSILYYGKQRGLMIMVR